MNWKCFFGLHEWRKREQLIGRDKIVTRYCRVCPKTKTWTE